MVGLTDDVCAKIKLQEYPEVEEEFIETQKLIKVPSAMELSNKIQTYLFTDDIALSQIFQRAELLIKRGTTNDAYQWFNQAVKRFPDNVLAWRSKGDFEFRYLKDDIEGTKSLKKAIELNPKDPISYNGLAYWEYDRGKEYNRKLNFKKSIEFNEKALDYSPDEDFSKKIKDHIAAALMKLAYISRDEAIRTRNPESFKIADHYFTQVINTLKGNLFPELTENYQEMHHNIIDHYLLANAYLMLGRHRDKNRKLYDLKAISHLILGLRLDQRNSQLIYTLGRPGVKNILREFNIVYYGMVNDNVARRLVGIESRIVSEINNLEKL